MTRASLAGWTIGSGFVLMAVVSGRTALRGGVELAPDPAELPSQGEPVSADGLLHGRVTLTDGTVHEGRLRFGGDEEGLWTHYFNGAKATNPWVDSAPESALVRAVPRELVGIEFGSVERRIDLDRPFMARFGDIARIDADRRALRVTLRSGGVVSVARFEADDFADGIRVWDDTGMVDLDEWSIRSVEFLPTPEGTKGPAPLHGTVRTASGPFTGLLQWDREEAFVSDLLEGVDAAGNRVSLPFATFGSLERESGNALRGVTVDGEEVRMTGAAIPDRGIYVDDARYGRVLVSWAALEAVEFSTDRGAVGIVPGFEDFSGGAALSGSVVTRSGERLTGRLVYDLDESLTIETLDAPWFGVDYTIPFGLIGSIEPIPADPGGELGATRPTARVVLRSGEVMTFEAEGDLGPDNAGVLIFPRDGGATRHVAWTDVGRIDLDLDPAGG
jgi:hypothetical protein